MHQLSRVRNRDRIRARAYQAGFIDNIFETDGDLLIESPTGSGKTTLAVASITMLMESGRATHAIIAAPQKQIEEGFAECGGLTVAWPRKDDRPPLEIPPGFIRTLRGGGKGIARRVLAYLDDPNPGYVLAITHAALTTLVRRPGQGAFPAELAGCILIVDECHHAPATGLSATVEAWEARGGRLLYFSATPYRGDGLLVIRPNMTRLRRSLSEHMASGYAPRHVEQWIVAWGNKGDNVSGAEFAGEAISENPAAQRRLINLIVSRWEADGRPKTICRVPPMAGGCAAFVAALVARFRQAGARVLDGTGVGKEHQVRFLAALKAERTRTHAESCYDVMIGCQRVVEGTDWPVCSSVYCVGVPGSLQMVVQLLGRAMRPKKKGHPHRDAARITFFVNNSGGETLDKLSLEHSRHALKVCVLLAGYEVGSEWVVESAIRAGTEGGPVDVIPPGGEDVEGDKGIEAEVKLFMAAEWERRGGKGVTVGQLIDAAKAGCLDAPDSVLNRVATDLIAVGTEKGRERIRKTAASLFRTRPGCPPDRRAIFAEVVGVFRDTTLDDARSLRALSLQVHTVTGRDAEAMASRFRAANIAGDWLTIEQIIEMIREYIERHGKRPSLKSGEIKGTGGLTWNALDQRLKTHHGTTLAKLIDGEFGSTTKNFTIDDAILWIREHIERHGKRPTRTSGEIKGTSGLTWVALCGRLRRHHGTTLTRLMDANLGSAVKDYTLDDAVMWVKVYIERHGKRPTDKSGEIPGTGGLTWMALCGRLRRHHGTTLTKLVDANFLDTPRLPKSHLRVQPAQPRPQDAA